MSYAYTGYSLRGLGNTGPGPDLPNNPCGLWDYVWVRDPCLAFLQANDPTNPLAIGATQGTGAMLGASVGEVVGSTVSNTFVPGGQFDSNSLVMFGLAALVGL